MNITIEYFGQLRQAADLESETVDIDDGLTLPQLLSARAAHFGDDFKKILLNDQGDPRPSVILVRNGAALDRNNLPTLQNGDRLRLLAAIAGG